MTESALTSNEVKSPQPSNNAKPATLQPQAQVEPPVMNPEASINSAPDAASSTQYVASSNKLFVGGLAHLNHTNEMLEEYFSKWGKVLSFQIIKVSLESATNNEMIKFRMQATDQKDMDSSLSRMSTAHLPV